MDSDRAGTNAAPAAAVMETDPYVIVSHMHDDCSDTNLGPCLHHDNDGKKPDSEENDGRENANAEAGIPRASAEIPGARDNIDRHGGRSILKAPPPLSICGTAVPRSRQGCAAAESESRSQGEHLDPAVPLRLTHLLSHRADIAATWLLVFLFALDTCIILSIVAVSPGADLNASGLPDAVANVKVAQGVLYLIFVSAVIVANLMVLMKLAWSWSANRSARGHVLAGLIKMFTLYSASVVDGTDSENDATLRGLSVAHAVILMLEIIVISVLVARAGLYPDLERFANLHRRNIAVRTEEYLKGMFSSAELDPVSARRAAHTSAIRAESVAATRKAYNSRFMGVFCLCVIFASITTNVGSIYEVLTKQPAFFTLAELAKIHNERDASKVAGGSTIGPGERTHNSSRLMVILVDGLRFDFADEVAFWEEATYARNCTLGLIDNCVSTDDAAVWVSRTNVPTMSVPNWLAMWSGAPPEITGQIGNLLAEETQFDTIFNVTKAAGVRAMSQGNIPVIQSFLPLYGGDHSLKDLTAVREKSPHDIDEFPSRGDQQRRDIALQVIERGDHDLMFFHMQDVDEQGHCCGVLEKFNARDGYRRAARGAGESIRKYMEAVGNDTTVLVVSDHGHTDPGGHGGIDHHNFGVPFMAFRRGSGLGVRVGSDPRDRRTLHVNDYAATIAAILGVRTPAQSFGSIIRDVFNTVVPPAARVRHARDLYAQKTALLGFTADLFQAKIDYDQDDDDDGDDDDGDADDDHDDDDHHDNDDDDDDGDIEHGTDHYYQRDKTERVMRVCEDGVLGDAELADACLDAVDHMLYSYGNFRNRMSSSWDALRAGVGFVLALLPIVVATVLLVSFSQADPRALLPPRLVSPVGLSPRARRKNVLACLAAFVAVGTTVGLSAAIYMLAAALRGYTNWDSSIIHEPAGIPAWLITAMLPPAVFLFVFIRIVAHLHLGLPAHGHAKLARARMIISDTGGVYSDPAFLYLFYVYTLYATVVMAVLILYLGFETKFFAPGTLLSRRVFIDNDTWARRFQLVTVTVFFLPVAIIALWHQVSFSIDHVERSGFVGLRELGRWVRIESADDDDDVGGSDNASNDINKPAEVANDNAKNDTNVNDTTSNHAAIVGEPVQVANDDANDETKEEAVEVVDQEKQLPFDAADDDLIDNVNNEPILNPVTVAGQEKQPAVSEGGTLPGAVASEEDMIVPNSMKSEQ